MVVHRELNLSTSYTMEASFCGCDQRRERGNDAESGNAPASDEPGSNSSSVHNGGTPAPAPSADGIVYSGGFHFSSNHLQQIGYRFCRALHVYFGLGAPPNSESKLEEPPGAREAFRCSKNLPLLKEPPAALGSSRSLTILPMPAELPEARIASRGARSLPGYDEPPEEGRASRGA